MGGTSIDYGSSRDYDFDSKPSVTKKSAASYAKDDKREYVAPTKGLPHIKGKDISSESKYAGAILLDQTGSMKDIPRIFIDKMPTLYAEANAAVQGKKLLDLQSGEKLEDLLEISVVAIGDSRFRESYPFQVLDYCKVPALVKGVLGIYPEGMGGGNLSESYDLGTYYLLNHSKTPNVPKSVKTPLIILGDEGFYPEILAQEVEDFIGDKLPNNLETKEIMKQLKKKFDVYVLRPELSYSESEYAKVQEQWEGVFGAERVLKMKEGYQRVVDCIIGIFGYAANNFENAKELLERRQKPEQVEEVLETLHPLLASKPKPNKKIKKLTISS